MQVQQEPALQGQPSHEQQQQEDQTQPGGTAGQSLGLALQPPEWDICLSVHHEHRGPHHCLLHACVNEAPDGQARLARLGPAGWEENHNCPTLLGFARCTQAPVGPGAALELWFSPSSFPLALLSFLSPHPCWPHLTLTHTVAHTFQKQLKI